MHCRGLHGFGKPAYLGGFLCCGLLRVAPYCVPGGIRVVSRLIAPAVHLRGHSVARICFQPAGGGFVYLPRRLYSAGIHYIIGKSSPSVLMSGCEWSEEEQAANIENTIILCKRG